LPNRTDYRTSGRLRPEGRRPRRADRCTRLRSFAVGRPERASQPSVPSS